MKSFRQKKREIKPKKNGEGGRGVVAHDGRGAKPGEKKKTKEIQTTFDSRGTKRDNLGKKDTKPPGCGAARKRKKAKKNQCSFELKKEGKPP